MWLANGHQLGSWGRLLTPEVFRTADAQPGADAETPRKDFPGRCADLGGHKDQPAATAPQGQTRRRERDVPKDQPLHLKTGDDYCATAVATAEPALTRPQTRSIPEGMPITAERLRRGDTYEQIYIHNPNAHLQPTQPASLARMRGSRLSTPLELSDVLAVATYVWVPVV